MIISLHLDFIKSKIQRHIIVVITIQYHTRIHVYTTHSITVDVNVYTVYRKNIFWFLLNDIRQLIIAIQSCCWTNQIYDVCFFFFFIAYEQHIYQIPCSYQKKTIFFIFFLLCIGSGRCIEVVKMNKNTRIIHAITDLWQFQVCFFIQLKVIVETRNFYRLLTISVSRHGKNILKIVDWIFL